jgi:lysophospholipase L1-like esterase
MAYCSRGFPIVALAVAGPQWDFAKTSVYTYGIALGGVPGFTAASLAACTWQTNSITADVDVIMIGINDLANSTTSDAICASIVSFAQSRLTLGTPKIAICGISPKTSLTVAQQKKRSQINRYLKDYCNKTKGLTYIDTNAKLVDPSTGYALTGFLAADGVHPAPLGAWAMGQPIGTWLQSIAPVTTYYPDYFDIYNATDNPYGAWAPTSGYLSFEGTGGASTGPAVTGTIPANYSFNRSSGSTTISAVGSKVARTDIAGSWYQAIITGAAGATESLDLSPQSDPLTLATYGVSPGDKIEGMLELNVVASSLLTHLDFQLIWQGVTSGSRKVLAFSDAPSGANAVLTDSAGKLWLRIPPTTVPVGATTVQRTIKLGVGATGSATIQLGRWWVSKARTV